MTKSGKTEMIQIRCGTELKTRFKLFRDGAGFYSYDEALDWILDHLPAPSDVAAQRAAHRMKVKFI